MTATTTTPEILTEQFGQVRARLPGADVPWLSTMREAGLGRFSELGWPNSKTEAWKYTSLKAVQTVPFGLGRSAEPAAKVDVVPCLFEGGQAGHRFVLVNGHYNANLSALQNLPDGVNVSSLADVLRTEPQLIEPHYRHTRLREIRHDSRQPLPGCPLPLQLNCACYERRFRLRSHR